MVQEQLAKMLDFDEVVTYVHNETYQFSIKGIRPKDSDYQLLFTDGLANWEQPVKGGYESFKRIELYFCLPDFWNLETQTWPIEWLERVGQVPQKNATWFGPGDTIPAGNPPQGLSARFAANHFVLSEPIELKDTLDGEAWTEAPFRFFAVIPILQQELDYKLRNSATVLITRLKNKGYTEKVDEFRTPVCRKRFLGF